MQPTPQHYTLRFKSHRLTVLLFVEPTETFTSIKTSLLTALREAGHMHIPTNTSSQTLLTLPTDPSNVIFGSPLDKHDLTKGFVALDGEEDEDEDEDGEENEGATKRKRKRKNDENTPIGVGLKDGGCLAFRFRGQQKEFVVEVPRYDDEVPLPPPPPPAERGVGKG